MKLKIKPYFIWAYPLTLFIIQIVHPLIAIGLGIVLFLLAVFIHSMKKIFLLFGLTGIGYSVWFFFEEYLVQYKITGYIGVIVGRFGLFGYLTGFTVWMWLAPLKHNYFRIGNVAAIIKFPFIWKGKEEPIWRFLFIFSIICFVPVCFFIFRGGIDLLIIIFGILFTFINATLEELLWRGLILPRVMEVIEKKQALLITSLTFGIYHISLGFPFWVCLIFAVGGFYMGGCTIISKGLLASWFMHIVVNFVFVFSGLIF